MQHGKIVAHASDNNEDALPISRIPDLMVSCVVQTSVQGKLEEGRFIGGELS